MAFKSMALYPTFIARAHLEEDLGVAEPPPVVDRLDALQDDLGGSLEVSSTGVDLLGLDDDEPVLEVQVDSSVGESSPTDPDALQHTVAGELVHDERGLNLAGLLVGVGHKATHKVRLTAVPEQEK